MASFGSRLAAARRARALTQSALAREADICGDTLISRYERDDVVPRTDTVKRLADALRVPFEWLCLGRGEAPEGVALPSPARTRPRRAARVAGAR